MIVVSLFLYFSKNWSY